MSEARAIEHDPLTELLTWKQICESLGFGFDDFRIHVHDLPSGFGIDGLLGLSFLKRFNYTIRSTEGGFSSSALSISTVS
jgi:hypothetical protein